MTETVPPWFDRSGLSEAGPGRVFVTTTRYPLFYLQITKCGCTFLRNLIYYLDHDALHPDSGRIHAHNDDFVGAHRIPRWYLKRSPYLFTVVRDPIDRFLSLYFDKIGNLDNPHDTGMRKRVSSAAELDLRADLDIEGHRENCLKTLAWFKINLAGQTPGKPNPHWQHQAVRLNHVKGLNPRLLTLDGLSWQLPILLAPIIPDIQSKMDAVTIRNKSKRLFSRAEFLTPEIKAAVHEIYSEDAATHKQAQLDWGLAPAGT